MENVNSLKVFLMAIVGTVGGTISTAFGGWDSGMTTLFIVMVVDYVTGLMVAGVFHASKKTANGTLESGVGWKGLCKKGVILFFVLIAYRLDLAANTTFIQNGTVIAFMVNEIISITENAGLMGIPIPSVIMNGIEVLKKKTEGNS